MASDLEHGTAPANTETMSSNSSEHPSFSVLEPIKTNHSCRSTAQRQDDADLYETVHRAITPDVETDGERIAQIKTATSIASAATRPPDFEVIFEEGDPENPKN
jgi:hypothetical protein